MEDVPAVRQSSNGDTWSIIAPHRASRPRLLATGEREAPPWCHFCEGNERETEPEVFAIRTGSSPPDTPGWQVRVVPNKYPALKRQQDRVEKATEVGFHEVVVESPDHDRRLGGFAVEEMTTLLRVYQGRLRALCQYPQVRSVSLFRNEGAAAGASQEHPHAQILALPMVPSRLAREIRLAQRHLGRSGCCRMCDLVDRERVDVRRLIAENAEFVAIAAFAPRFPYEIWLVPRHHAPDFSGAGERQLSLLASILKDVLSGLNSVLGTFPFNLILQTAPARAATPIQQAYHWRVEIVPRLTTPSGFELGTGIFIIATPPEEAARILRDALRSSGRPPGAASDLT